MSTNRIRKDAGWADNQKLQVGPNGRILCRYCSKETAPPRRTFCSDECIHEWKLRTQPGYLREQIFKRDQGICRICGVQASKWAADHILPVVEGGGECGMENIRTLCNDCHKIETTALRKRMTEAKKLSKSNSNLETKVIGE